MPDRSLRRRIPSYGRKSRPPHPTPSPHRRTPTPRLSTPSKPIKILHRSCSEPILYTVGFIVDDDEKLTKREVLIRPQTCTDVLARPHLSLSPSPSNPENYKNDSKVVVNVTVEGSPGPVRTMVRLGASVEETIKLVVDKYGQEGRSPKLEQEATSLFELHHSYFSLQSLDKKERIGDVGSRSFYLTKHCYSSRSGSESEIVATNSSSPSPTIQPQLFPSFIVRRINKIGRRTRKFWKVLGCIACGDM